MKRKYTMTELAYRQRKQAGDKRGQAPMPNSYKHGLRSQTILGKIKPCLSTCPQYPCELVEAGHTKKGGACLEGKEGVIKSYIAIIKGIKDKDYTDFSEMIAFIMAESLNIIAMLLSDINKHGTTVSIPKLDAEGNVIGHELKLHPALLPLPKMLADMGLSLGEFLMTPRSQSRAETDTQASATIANVMSVLTQKMSKDRLISE